MKSLSTVTGQRAESVARIEIFCDAHLGRDNERVRAHFETALYEGDKLVPGSQQFGSQATERQLRDLTDAERKLVSDFKALAYRMLEADAAAREKDRLRVEAELAAAAEEANAAAAKAKPMKLMA